MAGISGFNGVGEDKSRMFRRYCSPQPIHPRWYEFPLGICCRGDLNVAPSLGEEDNVHDIIRLYKDEMREDAMEFGDPLASACASNQQELKIAERVVPYNSSGIDKVARIDEREEKHRKWKANHRNARMLRARVSKEASSKENNP